MPIPVLMPALSPTMEKGNLAKWVKQQGDKVKSGDIIAEIETDKATMEVEATDEGTLAKWQGQVGDEVKSVDVIAEIETDKATMEVEAVDEGKGEAILVPEGAQGVKVNTPIARLAGENGEAVAAPPPAAQPLDSSSSSTLSIGSRVLRISSTSSRVRYLAGSLIEWPRKRYVRASMNVGPSPARARSAASRVVRATSSMSLPSIEWPGMP